MQFSVGDNFACIYACRVLIFFGVVSKPLHSSFIQNQESAHHHKLITTVYVARVHSHKPSVTTIVIFSITSKNNFRLSNPKCHLDGRLAFPRTPSSHLHNLTLTVPATRRLYWNGAKKKKQRAFAHPTYKREAGQTWWSCGREARRCGSGKEKRRSQERRGRTPCRSNGERGRWRRPAALARLLQAAAARRPPVRNGERRGGAVRRRRRRPCGQRKPVHRARPSQFPVAVKANLGEVERRLEAAGCLEVEGGSSGRHVVKRWEWIGLAHKSDPYPCCRRMFGPIWPESIKAFGPLSARSKQKYPPLIQKSNWTVRTPDDNSVF